MDRHKAEESFHVSTGIASQKLCLPPKAVVDPGFFVEAGAYPCFGRHQPIYFPSQNL